MPCRRMLLNARRALGRGPLPRRQNGEPDYADEGKVGDAGFQGGCSDYDRRVFFEVDTSPERSMALHEQASQACDKMLAQDPARWR